MVVTIFLFILGFLFLIKGASAVVDGSSSIASKFGLSSFFIGLTIVAFGTSAPEFFISILASIKGSADIALGNIIGSNISNTLLVLGVAALVTPLAVRRRIINREIPFSFLAILAVIILVNDKLIANAKFDLLNKIDGLILILLFGIFIYYTFVSSKDDENFLQKAVDELKEQPKKYSILKSSLMILIGFAGLTIGGKWIVDGASFMAGFLSINEALIGLTIVAIGTSLPELTTSIIAARKNRTDMAIGSVIGSNIFNFLLVLGLSSVIKPISYNAQLNIDMLFLIFVTIALILLVYIGKKNILGREEGVVLIFLYFLYIVFLIHRHALSLI